MYARSIEKEFSKMFNMDSYAFRKQLTSLGNLLAGLLILLFIAFPIFWLLVTAFKPERLVFTTETFFTPSLAAFQAIFTKPLQFGPLALNSFLISGIMSSPATVFAANSHC